MFQFIEFDGVSLPLYEHGQPHDPMPSESTLLDSIGGAFDWIGDARKNGRKQAISPMGVFVGETDFIVDENGNFLVDESGNFIIWGDAEQTVQASVVALLEKKGVTGQLWRKRLKDDVRQWKTARLLAVPWPRVWEDHALKAELTCQFETNMEFWRSETATTTSDSASDGVALYLPVNNAGQVVDDAIITITRTSGTITAVSLSGTGIDLDWTGSLGDGDVLTIDCGKQTVKKNSADAYSGFSLGAVHTLAGWLQLNPGSNTFLATVTGGNATVSIEHFDQFP